MTSLPVDLTMWVPAAVASALAAIVWVLVAVVCSYGRYSPLQYASAVLGCAHAAGFCKAVLIVLGTTTGDPGGAALHLAQAVACMTVGACVAGSYLTRYDARVESSAEPEPVRHETRT